MLGNKRPALAALGHITESFVELLRNIPSSVFGAIPIRPAVRTAVTSRRASLAIDGDPGIPLWSFQAIGRPTQQGRLYESIGSDTNAVWSVGRRKSPKAFKGGKH